MSHEARESSVETPETPTGEIPETSTNAPPDSSDLAPGSEEPPPKPAAGDETLQGTSGRESPVEDQALAAAKPDKAARASRRGRHAAPRGVTAKTGRSHSVRLDDVSLLTTDANGPIMVPCLVLFLDDTGIVVDKDSGEQVWASMWSEIFELSTPERSRTPGGERGVVVVVTAPDGGEHRFVVPVRRPASLEKSLGAIARKHGAAPDRPDRPQSKILAAFVVVVSAAAVAVLLLMAGHVIHLR